MTVKILITYCCLWSY